MADWQNLDLGFEAILSPFQTSISQTFSGVAGILNTAISTLEVLANFLQVSQSPLLAAVLTLRGELLNLLQDLRESGVYGLFLVPETLDELQQYSGGYGKFRQLMLESLNDVEDSNRPQIPSTGSLGGVILYLSSDNPLDLVLKGQRLFDFFSRPFDPSLPTPLNFSVSPAYINPSNQLEKTSAFQALLGETPSPNSLIFEWQEPSFANDVVYDFFARSSFVIERSKSRQGSLLLDPEEITGAHCPGEFTYDFLRDNEGRTLTYWEPVEINGSFLIEATDLIDPTQGGTSFGFLSGTYAFNYEGISPGADNGYYYRVRAVPPSTSVQRQTRLIWDPLQRQQELDLPFLFYEGSPLSLSLSPASAPALGVLPQINTTLDVSSAVLNLYRVLYLLRFDQSFVDLNGNEVVGSGILSETLPEALWRTTSGVVSYEEVFYFNEPLFESTISTYVEAVQKLAVNNVQSISTFDPFGGADEFLAPSFTLPSNERVLQAIDQLSIPGVRKIVSILADNEGLLSLFETFYNAIEPSVEGVLLAGFTQGDLVGVSTLRSDLYEVFQIISGFSSQGNPPNWEALKILQDLFPGMDQASLRLFDLISSFESILTDASGELQEALQGIQSRLQTVQNILTELDTLINEVSVFLTLDLDIDLLYIPPGPGGNTRFISELLQAGNAPDSGPEDFFVAIALLAGGASQADVSAISNVFSLIFGV